VGFAALGAVHVGEGNVAKKVLGRKNIVNRAMTSMTGSQLRLKDTPRRSFESALVEATSQPPVSVLGLGLRVEIRRGEDLKLAGIVEISKPSLASQRGPE